MDGWRISKRRYANPPAAAFDGEGSRRRGGRWTPPGSRVAYSSSSLALASLEYFVNLDPEDAPADLVSIRVSIPGAVKYEQVIISSLPESWRKLPFPQELWAVGERWLVSASSVCLLVPSAVVPQEFNLLINPSHPIFQRPAVLGAGGVQLRSADVEVIVGVNRLCGHQAVSRPVAAGERADATRNRGAFGNIRAVFVLVDAGKELSCCFPFQRCRRVSQSRSGVSNSAGGWPAPPRGSEAILRVSVLILLLKQIATHA